jgi:AP endonuclease-2
MVRITTWNVNGIRNPFGYEPWRNNRSFNAMFDILEADIVIMQELKIQRKDLRDDMVLIPGWDCYFSLPKHKKGKWFPGVSIVPSHVLNSFAGYSGVAIYTRQSVCAPIRAEEGLLGVLCPPGSSTPYRELPDDACIGGYPSISQVAELGVDAAALDAEGRCVVVEFPAFVLFGVYSPANSSGNRDDFSIGFRCALDTRIRNLAKMGKNVILTGDLNVSREDIDSARAEESMREEGETYADYLNRPTRRLFNQLIENGRVPGERDEGREKPVLWDICREFHPKREGMYTHWEQKINARPGNFGSRIDYVLCSIGIKSWFNDANIQEGLMGSDHCPVYASTKDVVEWHGEQTHILDILNPPGMFKDGNRLRDFNPAKDLLPMSGKLLPEFTKRRSIKDMFAKKPTLSPSVSASETSSTQVGNGQETKVQTAMQPPAQAALSTPAVVSPLSGSQKRRTPSGSPMKPVKRSKSSFSNSNPPLPLNGQQSLKGFFAPKPRTSQPASTPEPAAEDSITNTQESNPSPTPSSIDAEPFIDPEASKESWTKLFSKRPIPRCEHGEPCTIFTVKKAGPNCGRQFYLCSR